MVKNPHSWLYFSLPFFLIALAFVILLSTLLPYYDFPLKETAPLPSLAPMDTISPSVTSDNVFKFTNSESKILGVSFDYPETFKITEVNGKVVITNSFIVAYNTQKPSKVNVDNFYLTISKLKGDLKTIQNEFYLDENLTISRGSHIFLTGWMGAEGSGEKHYLLNIGGGEWLAVNHLIYSDQDIDLKSREDVRYLTSRDQSEIVDIILSSIKTSK